MMKSLVKVEKVENPPRNPLATWKSRAVGANRPVAIPSKPEPRMLIETVAIGNEVAGITRSAM